MDFNKEFDKLVEKHKGDKNPWYENPLSQQIVSKKYLYPDESHPLDMVRRVCSNMSKPELGLKLAELMITGSFFPGGRSLYGLGSKGRFNATTSNCYTQPMVGDSLSEIYESNKECAIIFKSGGGIGINLSNLRPNGAKTNNAARTSTGAASFIHLYNTTGSIIGFHGRRGATLVGLNMSHPDIEEFIDLRKNHDLSAMNISCLIDDKFMEAVLKRGKYLLHFEVQATGERIEREVDAYELYRKLCEMGWDYGDPGVIFRDTIDRHNLMSHNKDFHIDISNPCSEFLGPAYASCNLGSMNLYNYIDNKFTDKAIFAAERFRKDVATAVKVLNDILDYGYELQPLHQNRETIDKWRPIGLGFWGFADALVAMKIQYGSKESIDFAEKACFTLMDAAFRASCDLGKRDGSFKKFDKKSLPKSEVLKELDQYNGGSDPIYQKIDFLRNAQLVSLAPTGTLALIAGQMSSGIEPIFKCVYQRSTHQLESKNISFQVADRAIGDLLDYHGITEPLSNEDIKKRFPWVIESMDIDPIQRVRVQAAMQKMIDNAISSTVNLPESATVEDVERIYMEAWKLGIKGITVFRDNCKRAGILGFGKKKEEEIKNNEVKMDSLEPLSRKTMGPLEGRTYRKQTACVRALYITINRDENNQIFEVFTNKSIHGCAANIATITRMVSLALRSGVSVRYIIDELKENTCQACQAARKKNKDISLSCPYAIAEALEEEYNRFHNGDSEIEVKKVETKKTVVEEKTENTLMVCPECKERALLSEGKCVTCKRCGYSRCD